jgi:hypothetical protein
VDSNHHQVDHSATSITLPDQSKLTRDRITLAADSNAVSAVLPKLALASFCISAVEKVAERARVEQCHPALASMRGPVVLEVASLAKRCEITRVVIAGVLV